MQPAVLAYIAQQLAVAGHHIIVTDLNAAHAKEAAEDIVTKGGKAQGYALNVADSEAITVFLSSYRKLLMYL